MTRNDQFYLGVGVAAFSVIILGGAFWFQLALGLQPCKLCLEQRYAYYAAIPLGLLLSRTGERPTASFWLGASLSLLFAANALLAGYHAGIEWGFWSGPTSCSGTIAGFGNAKDIYERLGSEPVVLCNRVQEPFPIFGLSLAGYDAIISALLCAMAAKQILKAVA
ncbi:disulfide bond formation protein B [Bradyrhizobium sp. Cp5.3]|uniref:disulfide bond formation protein B n=1 Tax=Bradyrhizobium sp. Cp5.3 TaxID=443598 RepID=UPI0006891D4C|nr:disulfide bond formation protein B [Bradyrhizobium sp. Cp5.3]